MFLKPYSKFERKILWRKSAVLKSASFIQHAKLPLPTLNVLTDVRAGYAVSVRLCFWRMSCETVEHRFETKASSELQR